ncbi:unnamed protein product, partial [marine sediment metagenome]
IKRKYPNFFERSPLKYLESADTQRDSVRVVLGKVLVQSMLRKRVAHWLKKIANDLDGASRVQLPSLVYQYVLASYYVQGVKARDHA